jgi:hypothetical protein
MQKRIHSVPQCPAATAPASVRFDHAMDSRLQLARGKHADDVLYLDGESLPGLEFAQYGLITSGHLSAYRDLRSEHVVADVQDQRCFSLFHWIPTGIQKGRRPHVLALCTLDAESASTSAHRSDFGHALHSWIVPRGIEDCGRRAHRDESVLMRAWAGRPRLGAGEAFPPSSTIEPAKA